MPTLTSTLSKRSLTMSDAFARITRPPERDEFLLRSAKKRSISRISKTQVTLMATDKCTLCVLRLPCTSACTHAC